MKTISRNLLLLAVIQQIAAGVLLFMVSEAADLLRMWGAAMLVFWTWLFLVSRRKTSLTRVDIVFVKYGFIPLLIGTCYLFGLIWKARGLM